ncbi:unnamed protein product [Soboliphyme baturini]|uniref:Prothymosin alpha n=1 Tax=Soboliphyme baturini TaxID=241478 RepID=A0A183IHA2_9BILA|nr:unnamed protein product [Soboliphyme baturini]
MVSVEDAEKGGNNNDDTKKTDERLHCALTVTSANRLPLNADQTIAAETDGDANEETKDKEQVVESTTAMKNGGEDHCNSVDKQ